MCRAKEIPFGRGRSYPCRETFGFSRLTVFFEEEHGDCRLLAKRSEKK